MAYAALVSHAQTTDIILNHPTYSISLQEKHQITSVKKYSVLLQEFLEDFPDKADGYEGRIRELTHGAESILELSLSEHLQQSLSASLRSSNSTSSPLQTGQYQCRRYESYSQLNKVTKEIELIADEVMAIKNNITNKDERVSGSTRVTSSPSRTAPMDKETMVGLDNNLMEVKLRLCRDSSKLEILPIVGMGGIGKTTLAKTVYDDPLIMERFDIRAWVTVSQYYDFKEIVSSILVCMGLSEHNVKYYKVHQHLKGRKYLIVLDDIWSIKAWDELKLMFPDDGNGSRIILTTRLSDVANYAGCAHEMRLMDDKESWNLLRRRVFKHSPCPNELENIGKKIAISCRGLPLAVAVISGILAVDQTEVAWKNIAKDVKSAISTNDEQIDKILSLSYTHLPHHLRACFLYMGGFPEDYRMRASTLIKLWVAEGFLKPDGFKSFEETAEEYLEDLVKRSLFMVTDRKSNGGIKVVGMHDLMREMCARKAQEEIFFLNVRGVLQQGTTIPHRLSSSIPTFLANVKGSNTRTIICLRNRLGNKRWSLAKFKLLRILAVSNDWGELSHRNSCLPAQVFELFHLRYLAFDWRFNALSSISNFRNLQTLIIGSRNKGCFGIGSTLHYALPVQIWMMPQVRHILVYYGFLPIQEEEEKPLENLQTLSGVESFVCAQKTLKLIPNVKKLGLVYCNDRVGSNEDYELENIKHLQHLEILKIVNGWCDRPKLNPAFPKTIKKLSLEYLKLPWEDMSVVASLPRLKVLKLRCEAYIGDTWETNEGGFPELNYLLIEASDLKQWITESSHFPRLKCLVLRHFWCLHEIPESIGEISTLEEIEVNDCNEDLVCSAKQIQEDQQSYGNDALQIRVVSLFH